MSPQRASRLFALTCPLCPSGGVQSRPSLAARARRTRGPRADPTPCGGAAGLPQTLIQCPTSWTCTYPHPAALYTLPHTRPLSQGLATSWEKACVPGLRSCSGPLCQPGCSCRAQNRLRELTPGPRLLPLPGRRRCPYRRLHPLCVCSFPPYSDASRRVIGSLGFGFLLSPVCNGKGF